MQYTVWIMKTATPPANAHKIIATTLIIMLAIGIIFLLPFFSAILFACLMAFLFMPAYKRILRHVKIPAIASFLTLILTTLVIAAPLIILITLTFGQLSLFADEAAAYFSDSNTTPPDFLNSVIASINNFLEPISNNPNTIESQSIVEYLKTAVPDALRAMVDILVGVLGSLPAIALFGIIAVILFLELLMHGDRLVGVIRNLIPFNKKDTETYLRRIGMMTNAMVKGQFVISAALSAISSFLLIFLGFGDYFFLLFTVCLILNLVPLGSSVLVIPLIIIVMLMGNVVPGLIILILFLLSGNLEHVIRPHVIPKEAQLSPSLTMLAAFGGLAYFGMLGLIYGPVIMIIITTTIDLYIASRKKHAAAV